MKFKMRVLAASLVIAAAPLALAQTTPTGGDIDATISAFDVTAANKGQTHVAEKIAAFFTNLAGSKENAIALVNALRNGTAVNLTAPAPGTPPPAGTTPPAPTTTTFTPPTGKMGWGNVKISLGLAQDALLRAGITKPTAAQLQTALLGGTITKADGTTVTLKGVLQMRADGMGWGQIAHAGGTKVGPVVSSLKATQAQLAKLPATTAAPATTTSKGVTTAAGTTAGSGGKGPKGITTATGAAPTGSSKGVVTAEGGTAGHTPKGNAHGRGIVTGAGTSAGSSVAATGGKHSTGAGLVTGSGGTAAGVTTGQGNAGGNGKGQGHGSGKGKGGG